MVGFLGVFEVVSLWGLLVGMTAPGGITPLKSPEENACELVMFENALMGKTPSVQPFRIFPWSRN